MWQDERTNEDILSALKKMNSAVKKIQNYGNKWTQHVWQMDRLPHLIIKYQISAMWETKPRTYPQKTSRLLIGLEQVMRSENLMTIFS